ncbi:MAG: transglutaminase domain-containing protein [Anaerolineales bacterium]|nr:transglutaminase domain-containing protein [Anaerolineales bacterium]
MITARRFQPMDWLSAFFYIFMLELLALALNTADWTDNLEVIPTSMLISLLLGTALARSRFKGWLAALFSTLYGLFFIVLQLGRTLSDGLAWSDRIRSLYGRTGVFLSVVLEGETNEDPLMFVLLMAVAFWILAAAGTWSFFRKHRFWAAVLPAGFALLINSYFYIGRASMATYLATYILILLFLAVRTDLADRMDAWSKIRAQVPGEADFYITRIGAAAAVLLIAAAWGGPAFVRSEQAADLWRTISRPVRTVRDRIGEAFGDLRSPMTLVYDAYGEQLTLDSGVEPLDEIVMEVEAEVDPGKNGRFYWRNRTYAVYENGTWSGTVGELIEVRAKEPELEPYTYEAREELLVNVFPKQKALRVLNLPAQPTFFNRDAEVLVIMDGDTIVDINLVEAEDLVYNGDLIRAKASVAVPTAEELRLSGTVYPDWVTQSYLQLPETITERTRELAESITSDYDNSYDKVMAITTWLRANIEYQRVIAAPEDLIDPLDWFLFDARVGYCNWYATAEVIMLRSVGIPARMAVGYSSGSHDPVEQLYVVSNADAHAWPEVYFPRYGWVEFEPTGNQPSLVRPEDPASMAGTDYRDTPWVRLAQEEMFDERLEEGSEVPEFTEEDLNLPLFSTGFKLTLQTWLTVIVAVIACVFLWLRMDPLARISAAGLLAGGMRRVGLRPPERLDSIGGLSLTTAGILYARWSRWMERLGVSMTIWQTPYERAALFSEMFPESSGQGWQVASAYSLERYAGIYSDIWKTRTAWRDLRIVLWKAYLSAKVEKLRQYFHNLFHRTH